MYDKDKLIKIIKNGFYGEKINLKVYNRKKHEIAINQCWINIDGLNDKLKEMEKAKRDFLLLCKIEKIELSIKYIK